MNTPELVAINPLMLAPFGILLAVIALAPLFFADWWGRHYIKVVAALAAIVIGYYLLGLETPQRVLQTTRDYISFIVLIGSLFIVSGGIHINVTGEATPFHNVLFLMAGALVANIVGTTGASMLLIRPWLRANRYRVTGHHVVFFILIISNVGGCLTPVGDPPLFLGYLMGVPFGWVMVHCLPMWALGVSILLAMFYVVDRRNFTRAPREVRIKETAHEQLKFDGLFNVFFLAVVIGAVFINHPPFLRETVMACAAVASYFVTGRRIHESNQFTLGPIKEVAILFVGIFATMMPALDWLQKNTGNLETASPGLFYWGSGALSSVLDNAPTYLCFLKASFGRFVHPDVVAQVSQMVQNHGAGLANVAGAHAEEVRQTFAALQQFHPADVAAGRAVADQIQTACLLGNARLKIYIVAVSVGSVFFGANTYIGNGPNFMVKAIADHQKVHTPTFLGYVFNYTLPFMLPMLLIIWWIFFRC